MEELLCLDVSESFADLHLPFVENLNFGETLNQLVNTLESILGLSDHVTTQFPHFIGISSETCWEGCLVAS